MSDEQMTPLKALEILDRATTPGNIAKLNRVDFVNIENALRVLAHAITPTSGVNGAAEGGP